MTTLTIQPSTEDQETAIRIFLDALHVKYSSTEQSDDTSYLLSSQTNVRHLEKSMDQANTGEIQPINLDDIWKP